MAQGDPPAGEPLVGGVVVRGDEKTLDRLAPELRQPERPVGAQLHLAFDGLLDRHPSSVGRRVVDAAWVEDQLSSTASASPAARTIFLAAETTRSVPTIGAIATSVPST